MKNVTIEGIEPMLNQTLANRYSLTARIGSGAMGIVIGHAI